MLVETLWTCVGEEALDCMRVFGWCACEPAASPSSVMEHSRSTITRIAEEERRILTDDFLRRFVQSFARAKFRDRF